MDLLPFTNVSLFRLFLVTFFTASLVTKATTGTHVTKVTPVDQSINKTVSCGLTVQEQNRRLTRCVRLGDKLIKKYLRHLKATKDSRPFRLCQKFSPAKDCFDAVMSKCPTAEKLFDVEWLSVYKNLSCVCSKDAAACKQSHGCIVKNYWGPESEYCENLKQDYNTWSNEEICLSIPERTRCHATHVTLTCGKEAGEFTYHLTRVFLKRHLHRYTCHPLEPVQNLEFLPPSKCNGTSYLEIMDQCEMEHMPDMLNFTPHNALVADADRETVTKACRNYKAFKSCIRPVKETCKGGYKFVLSYDSDLRTYLDKMEYICRNALTEYLSNLPCYQDVVRKERLLNDCRNVLEKLKPAMTGVTSYQYYCHLQHPRSIALKRRLDDLRSCYHQTMTSSCGDVAGGIFNKLSERAFRDPLYLKFAYKPMCLRKLFVEPVTIFNDVTPHKTKAASSTTTTTPPVRQNETIWVKVKVRASSSGNKPSFNVKNTREKSTPSTIASNQNINKSDKVLCCILLLTALIARR